MIKIANIKILIYKTIPPSFTCAKLIHREGRQELRTFKNKAQLKILRPKYLKCLNGIYLFAV